MKKMLFVLPVIALIAASCSNGQSLEPVSKTSPLPTNTPSIQRASVNTLDATVSALEGGIAEEDVLQIDTDADVVSSDKTEIINAADKISNANNF